MMEARYGVIETDSYLFRQIGIGLLQCLGDNGAVVVDVIYDYSYNPTKKLFKVYWERFPIVDEGTVIPRYSCFGFNRYTSEGRIYRRTYEIKVGNEMIPLGSVVVKE